MTQWTKGAPFSKPTHCSRINITTSAHRNQSQNQGRNFDKIKQISGHYNQQPFVSSVCSYKDSFPSPVLLTVLDFLSIIYFWIADFQKPMHKINRKVNCPMKRIWYVLFVLLNAILLIAANLCDFCYSLSIDFKFAGSKIYFYPTLIFSLFNFSLIIILALLNKLSDKRINFVLILNSIISISHLGVNFTLLAHCNTDIIYKVPYILFTLLLIALCILAPIIANMILKHRENKQQK